MPLVLALLLVATVFTGCAHPPAIRPASVVFACGDGNFETLPGRYLKLKP